MLTEKRKKDRQTMATVLADLVRENGAEAEIRERGKREIVVEIRTARGVCLNVDFDGESWQPDVHVLSWHTSIDSDACFKSYAFGGSVNQCHRRKATDTAEGFDRLCTVVKRRLSQIANGSVFDLEFEQERIARDGTAAERNAKREAAFAEWINHLETKGATN
ncbi:hypothetical protein [Roseibium alexandrii]|uniref:hypothetical protein n=1 Tax=Roseibium alexandrii TaxID=388408 RepID=UPI00375373AF